MNKSKLSSEQTSNFSLKKCCKSDNWFCNLEDIIQSHQDEQAKVFGMSVNYLLEKEYSKSIDCLDTLISKNPDILPLYWRAANISILADDYKRAGRYIEELLEFDNLNLNAQLWFIICCYSMGENEKGKILMESFVADILFL